jgi:type IV secretion system protein VirB2
MTFKLQVLAARGCSGWLRHVAQPVILGFGVSTFVTLSMASSAWAAGSGMPWEAPLERILESVQGPVAKIVAVIIITVTGISLAFGDTSGGFRKMVQVVFGLSIAFAASSFFLSFFSFGGGALI